MEKRPHTRHPAPVWDAARATYLTGQTLSDVALAHGLNLHTVRARATRQGWSRARAQAAAAADLLPDPLSDASPQPGPPSGPAAPALDAPDPDAHDLAQAATRASALAMRAGELARAHALAGLAERYRKLAGSDDARHKALTPDTAPLQLVADILMDEGLANRRLALNNPKDPPCPTKIAYQDWDSRRSRVNRNFHFTLVHRRAACERYIQLLERALTAAALPLPDEPNQNRRLRLGLDVRVGDTVMSHGAYRARLGEE